MYSKLIVCLLALSLVLTLNEKGLFAIENSSSVTYPVGELGEHWQFPSDHLPVGLTVVNIHLTAWNVLNTKYIYHIMTNQQGLEESLIATSNFPVEMTSFLTIRESLIIDQVIEMINHPSHPRSIIALQEVGNVFFKELKRKLPKNMTCVTTLPDELGQGDIFIYDSNVFEWGALRSGHYQVRPRYSYMTLSLQEIETGLLYNFVQSHVPAAPGVSSPARREFAQEILSHFDPDAITIVMGDMNRSPDFLLKDFEEVAKDIGMKHQPLRNLWVPYATHIDTHKSASWIDNLFFYNPHPDLKLEVSRHPETFFQDLKATINLLRSFRPLPLEVSFEIWCKVKARGTTVIYGAPGSGKTEQMSLGLKGEHLNVFDLREEFLSYYYKVNNIEDSEERKQIRSQYSRDESFQALEYEWLNNNHIQLVEELLYSNADVIVFDEFDLIMNKELSPHKLSTLLTISSMAKRISINGKKVIFIVHDAGLESPIFWEELSLQLGLCRQDVVKTGFLSVNEEYYLLSFTDLSDEEKLFYQKWASGMPSAYLNLMEFAAESSSEEERLHESLSELMELSLANVEKLWKVLQSTQPQEVIEKLLSMALDDNPEHDPSLATEIDPLVKTGFVSRKNGHIVMPSLVREVISSTN